MDYSTTINASCSITLGRLITGCRRNAGLSQKELAQKFSQHCSIHFTELSRIECDRLPVYEPKFAWLSVAIAHEFDLDPEWVETIRKQTTIREGFMLVTAANFPHSKTTKNNMICHQCNTDNAKICNRDRVYREGNEILIVEEVPSISCQECGQVFYDANTLTHLQHIKDNKEKLASDRNVKIVNFSTATVSG